MSNDLQIPAQLLSIPKRAIHRASGLEVQIIKLNAPSHGAIKADHNIPSAKVRFPKGAILSVELDALQMIEE